ncbi:MAG: hypothetical protein MUF27_18280 [Acidobacteria bacterium]|jgi:hypothetical protein|nr:hypothetical protein [Acidobacteriota bacterium]
MNGTHRKDGRAATLALTLIALTVAAVGVSLAASPYEGTAWHLVAQRDETKVAGIGSWDWGHGEAMLFLLPGGTCRLDTYGDDGVIESPTPPSTCLADACLPCTWSGDSKGKRVTVKFSDNLAREIMVGNLTDIAIEEGYSSDFTFSLTKNKCSGVVKSGRMTVTWDIVGKLSTPDVKKKTASHEVLAFGTQVQ